MSHDDIIPPRRKSQIKNLTLDEVSFVERPCNKLATIALAKGNYRPPPGGTALATIDATLDWLASERAKEKGITHEKAMVEVLEEPMGRELYADRIEALNDLLSDPELRQRHSTIILEKAASPSDQVYARIVCGAEQIRESNETREAAVNRLLSQQPQLYREYLSAHRGDIC